MKLDIELLSYKPLLKIRSQADGSFVFDPIRKSYIKITPEELVRQCLLQHLLNSCGYSKNKIQVERKVNVLDQYRRFDMVVLNEKLKPHILVECKSFKEKLDIKAFKQSSHYNLTLLAPYTIISNGIDNYCYKVDYISKTYEFLHEIPRLL